MAEGNYSLRKTTMDTRLESEKAEEERIRKRLRQLELKERKETELAQLRDQRDQVVRDRIPHHSTPALHGRLSRITLDDTDTSHRSEIDLSAETRKLDTKLLELGRDETDRMPDREDSFARLSKGTKLKKWVQLDQPTPVEHDSLGKENAGLITSMHSTSENTSSMHSTSQRTYPEQGVVDKHNAKGDMSQSKGDGLGTSNLHLELDKKIKKIVSWSQDLKRKEEDMNKKEALLYEKEAEMNELCRKRERDIRQCEGKIDKLHKDMAERLEKMEEKFEEKEYRLAEYKRQLDESHNARQSAMDKMEKELLERELALLRRYETEPKVVGKEQATVNHTLTDRRGLDSMPLKREPDLTDRRKFESESRILDRKPTSLKYDFDATDRRGFGNFSLDRDSTDRGKYNTLRRELEYTDELRSKDYGEDMKEKATPDIVNLGKDLNVKLNLTAFSGKEPVPKNESSFEEFKLEFESVRYIYSDEVLKQALRKTLKAQARKTMLHLGTQATVDSIVKSLEENFGNVASEDSILSRFLLAEQNADESIVEWGLRLEEMLLQVCRKSRMDEIEEKVKLKNRFWRGLRSEELKQATRSYFDSSMAYEELRNKVRSEEFEMRLLKERSGTRPKPVKLNQATAETPVPQTEDMMSKLVKQVEELNRKFEEMKKSQDEHPKEQNRGYRFQRGGYRGARRGGFRGSDRGRQLSEPKQQNGRENDQKGPLNA